MTLKEKLKHRIESLTHAGVRYVRLQCPDCSTTRVAAGVMARDFQDVFHCFVVRCICRTTFVHPELTELCDGCSHRVECCFLYKRAKKALPYFNPLGLILPSAAWWGE